MKNQFLIITLCLISTASFAECSIQHDQMKAFKCMEQQLKTDKTKMNKLYQQVYNQYDEKNKALLEKSQKAWLNYRNAQCDELMSSLTYGALGLASGFANLDCQMSSTEFRLKELKSLIEN